jgi:hypothetical protein
MTFYKLWFIRDQYGGKSKLPTFLIQYIEFQENVLNGAWDTWTEGHTLPQHKMFVKLTCRDVS